MCSCLAEQKPSVLGSCDKSEMAAASQKRCRGHYYDGMQILVKLVRLIACGQAKITLPWVCRYRVAAIWQRFPERLQGK